MAGAHSAAMHGNPVAIKFFNTALKFLRSKQSMPVSYELEILDKLYDRQELKIVEVCSMGGRGWI
jgi:hypothetical protein